MSEKLRARCEQRYTCMYMWVCKCKRDPPALSTQLIHARVIGNVCSVTRDARVTWMLSDG